MTEQAPFRFFVVPVCLCSFSGNSTVKGEKNRAMVTTTQLIFNLSADSLGAEGQVRSCGGVPSSGVKGGCLVRLVD